MHWCMEVVWSSSRRGVARGMPGAQEEERAVGDGVLQSFCGALRIVEYMIPVVPLDLSPACAPSRRGGQGGATRTLHTACKHCATHSAGSNVDAPVHPRDPGGVPQNQKT